MQNIKAKKHLGQNFLQDENILHIISDYFDVFGQNIIEVGPGYGALTEFLLLKKPMSLHLVELDKDMVDILNGRLEKKELKVESIDFQIFHQDVLKFVPNFGYKEDPETSSGGQKKDIQTQEISRSTAGGQIIQGQSQKNYFVIANIPYYITSPILTHFLYDVPNTPQKMLILMQKEVGERILEGKIENEKGKTKRAKSSVLSLMIAKKCFTEKVVSVPKIAFNPAPKVDSIVLAFESHEKFFHIDDKQFLDFIKICFLEPRKKLQNNLIKGGFQKESIQNSFQKLGFSEMVRAEELSVETIIDLMELLAKMS